MAFHIVYIREAHPGNGWQVPENLIENIVYDEPATDQARTTAAATCALSLDLHMPMLVDDIENGVDRQYVGLPMRLFLVDASGTIAYAGDKGPRGWDDDAFEVAIQETLK